MAGNRTEETRIAIPEKVREAVDAKRQEVESLGAVVVSLRNEKAVLEKTVKGVETAKVELEQVTAQVTELGGAIDSLNNQRDALINDINSLQTVTETLVAQHGAANQLLASVRSQAVEARTTRDEASEGVKALLARKEALEGEIVGLSKVKERREKELAETVGFAKQELGHIELKKTEAEARRKTALAESEAAEKAVLIAKEQAVAIVTKAEAEAEAVRKSVAEKMATADATLLKIAEREQDIILREEKATKYEKSISRAAIQLQKYKDDLSGQLKHSFKDVYIPDLANYGV